MIIIDDDGVMHKVLPMDTLDKIRAELHANAEYHDDGDCYLRDEWIDEIFDKYRNEVNK
jgi:hypothetical protein